MIAITNKIIFGILFFKVKSGNFKDIILIFETISQLSKSTVPYRNHLLISRLLILPIVLKCRINGKEAINKPTAGTGTPLNEIACDSSKLNLPSLYAAAQARIKAGNSHRNEIVRPFSSLAKLKRSNW